jgi:nitrogen fixation protein FixH
VGALALATLILGACKSAAVAETKEIQTQRTKDLSITLLNEKGELTMGQNRFVIAFRSADNKPLDVGTVTVSSSMSMPGMAPMTASMELESAGTTGQYTAKSDFGMSGSWKFEVRWNGPAGSGATSFNTSVR